VLTYLIEAIARILDGSALARDVDQTPVTKKILAAGLYVLAAFVLGVVLFVVIRS
jgi:hypothetical protein